MVYKRHAFHFISQFSKQDSFEMIKLVLVLATVFIILFISLTDACSCIPRNDGWKNEKYCGSEFVGIIRILSPASPCGDYEICHSITVVEQLRGDPITPTIAKTPSSSAACGVAITEGETFFLATNPSDSNTIGIFSCGLHENLTELSDSTIKLKGQEYQQISCDDIPERN